MRFLMLVGGLVAGLMFVSILPGIAAEDEIRVFGPIQNVEGKAITARNADGTLVTFEASGRIVSNQPIALNEMTPGMSIALDTVMEGDRLVVPHVHTQSWARAPGTRPTRPLGSDPSATRHLGRIAEVTPIEGGVRMKVTHEGEQSEIVVDVLYTVPILYHNREEPDSAIKVGSIVMAVVAPNENGRLASGFVTIEVGAAAPVVIPD
jgi:hypothetical protein